jgi:hypothetical protein
MAADLPLFGNNTNAEYAPGLTRGESVIKFVGAMNDNGS